MKTSVLDATEAQLRRAQAKLTFLGPQTKPIPSIVLFTEGYAPSLDAFVPYHRSRRTYAVDDLPYTLRLAVSSAELMRMLRAAKALLVGPTSSGPELVSFTVVNETPSRAGEEFVIQESVVERFYKAAIGALDPKNSAARQALSAQAANVGVDAKLLP